MPTRLQRSRNQAFQSQCGKCFYCSVAMWLRSPAEIGLPATATSRAARLQCTAEHLHPRSEGGCDGPENIVAACAHCNHTRHKHKVPPKPEVYLRMVRRSVGSMGWHRRWVFKRSLLFVPTSHQL